MSAPAPPRVTGSTMFAGAIWAIAMRWSMRLLGLVSVVILARVLTPADFGIVAMAGIVIALIDSFADWGSDLVLLRKQDPSREDCDTAWSFRLLQGLVTGAVILAAAPLAAAYFKQPQLLGVMAVLALVAVVTACGNIGMTLVRKELRFAVDFRFGVYKKLAEFLPTVLLAFWLRDYRALVYGSLIGAVAGVLISYRMHPYRPRWSLRQHREYLAFSLEVVASNLARLLKNKVDVFVLGGSASAAATGSYNVAGELARMGTQEIVIPAWRGLFPSFAALRGEPERFVAAYIRLVGVIASLCLPLGVGLWGLAEWVVPTLLGSQWVSAIEPLQWLALGAALLALVETFGGSVLFVSGHERRAVVLVWTHLALLVPAVLLAASIGGIKEMALANLIVAALMVPISAMVVMRSLHFGAGLLLRALWRPVLATAAMALVLQLVPGLPFESAAVRLLVGAALGAASFVPTLFALWLLAGRPDGIETTVLGPLMRRLGRAGSGTA